MPDRAFRPCGRRRPRPAGPALLLLVLLLLVLPAGPALAHTELTSSDPPSGATPEAPVETLTLTYSRPIELLGDAVTVRGARGRVSEVVRSDDGTVVTATFDPPLAGGDWTVDWRVLAGDGHPREGSVALDVAAPAEGATDGATPPSTDSPASGAGTADVATTPPPSAELVERAATAARVVLYLGMLVAVGLVLFRAGPHRGEPERAWVLAGTTAAVAGIAAVAGVAEILLHVAVVSGRGLAGVADAATWSAVGRTGLGTAAALRTVGLALVAIGAGRRARRGMPSGPDVMALGGAVLAVGSFQFVGHTNSVAPEVVVRVADAVHAVAAAVWVGGIAGLALLARSPNRHARRRAAMRFADAATLAVVAVGLGGVALAWTTMPGVATLWSTAWGGVLVTKLALVAVLGAFGAHNHVRLVPRLDRDDRRAEMALRQLRRTVRVEAVLMVAILSLTAVLVGLSPV